MGDDISSKHSKVGSQIAELWQCGETQLLNASEYVLIIARESFELDSYAIGIEAREHLSKSISCCEMAGISVPVRL